MSNFEKFCQGVCAAIETDLEKALDTWHRKHANYLAAAVIKRAFPEGVEEERAHFCDELFAQVDVVASGDLPESNILSRAVHDAAETACRSTQAAQMHGLALDLVSGDISTMEHARARAEGILAAVELPEGS